MTWNLQSGDLFIFCQFEIEYFCCNTISLPSPFYHLIYDRAHKYRELY
jgi:hypothetical protein